MGRYCRLASLALAVVAIGCDGAPDDEVLGVQAELTDFDKYAVGVVLLDPSSCPAAKRVTLYTDDEDDANESDSTGWDAPGTARRSVSHNTGRKGTRWDFCKVDGRNFHSLTRYEYNTQYYYATLKLGTDCPNGSHTMIRYSTGEYDDNESSMSGPVGLNHFEWPGMATVPGGPVAVLYFCHFRDSTDKMTGFPDLGMQYAIFHDYDSAQPSSFVISKKWIYTDDEDDSSPSVNYPQNTSFDDLIGGRGNSMYDLARVR
jgi:hypothetical protein